MSRPPRTQRAGAVYWVSASTGAEVSALADDADRAAWLGQLAQTLHRFDAQALAYCLLPGQYQLLLFTRQANLSRLMRHLNGAYSQHHQRRHGSRGPLFQGRFKSVLVDREAWLFAACCHVELSPLRAGQAALADWPWSSYPAHAGLVAAPAWLDVDGLHGHVLGRPVSRPGDHRTAAARYVQLLACEPLQDQLSAQVRQQVFLGDAAFVARMSGPVRRAAATQARSWPQWLQASSSREQALYRAHVEGGLTMTALAAHLGLSVSRISRLIAGHEQGLRSVAQAGDSSQGGG